MNSRLLTIANPRSVMSERAENVASTRPAAA
jgi:hypothetical protein